MACNVEVDRLFAAARAGSPISCSRDRAEGRDAEWWQNAPVACHFKPSASAHHRAHGTFNNTHTACTLETRDGGATIKSLFQQEVHAMDSRSH